MTRTEKIIAESDMWNDMNTAPRDTTEVQGKTASGKIIERMHFAEDLSGSDPPAFSGWYVWAGTCWRDVWPVAWREIPKATNAARREAGEGQ